LEESAIVLSPTGPVIVSCRFLPHAEAEYRAACENAYYSLSLEEGPVKPVKKEKPTGDFPLLQDFALYHIPNNLPVPDPESLLQLLQPGKIQYDENYILPDEEYRY
ncbi:MAG: hypothetical protein NZL89_06330, partial [Leptospiraceae bacterium]|nr:hypothetical protein [Leptospiraceae bacterium]